MVAYISPSQPQLPVVSYSTSVLAEAAATAWVAVAPAVVLRTPAPDAVAGLATSVVRAWPTAPEGTTECCLPPPARSWARSTGGRGGLSGFAGGTAKAAGTSTMPRASARMATRKRRRVGRRGRSAVTEALLTAWAKQWWSGRLIGYGRRASGTPPPARAG